jgi:hypothetical protein
MRRSRPGTGTPAEGRSLRPPGEAPPAAGRWPAPPHPRLWSTRRERCRRAAVGSRPARPGTTGRFPTSGHARTGATPRGRWPSRPAPRRPPGSGGATCAGSRPEGRPRRQRGGRAPLHGGLPLPDAGPRRQAEPQSPTGPPGQQQRHRPGQPGTDRRTDHQRVGTGGADHRAGPPCPAGSPALAFLLTTAHEGPLARPSRSPRPAPSPAPGSDAGPPGRHRSRRAGRRGRRDPRRRACRLSSCRPPPPAGPSAGRLA